LSIDLNLIDWSSKGIVAVALGQAIYLWNGETGKVDQLSDVGYQGVIVTALSWAKNGKFLAVGLANGSIQLFDLEKSKKMRTMRGHTDRVISLHWNSYLLASGCKNGEIHLHDVRQQEHVIDKLLYHSLDVCGLEWSYDGTYLASGGNDNDVCIWKPSASNKPVFILQGHLAAVKALAWCPWQPSLLATGGGSKDQSIHFWDTRTGELLQSINAKSPVSSICWSTEHKELISSHGHPKCVLKIWKYPSLVKVAELKGHKGELNA
jgi:cell division cycle protein 20 (cofactor of APC complex)